MLIEGSQPRSRGWFGTLHLVGKIMLVLSAIMAAANGLLVTFFLVPRIGNLSFLRLHYTVAYGIDWEAEWWKIFLYPGLGLAVLVANTMIASMISRKNQTVGVTVLFVTLIAEAAFAGGGCMAVLLNS